MGTESIAPGNRQRKALGDTSSTNDGHSGWQYRRLNVYHPGAVLGACACNERCCSATSRVRQLIPSCPAGAVRIQLHITAMSSMKLSLLFLCFKGMVVDRTPRNTWSQVQRARDDSDIIAPAFLLERWQRIPIVLGPDISDTNSLYLLLCFCLLLTDCLCMTLTVWF
jgi:hypothetical protein